MGKAPGSPKTGGRKKGTPNVRTFDLCATLSDRAIDPLDEILKEAKRLSGRDRVKIYMELLPYIYPKRKPAEKLPFTLENYIENLSMPQLGELHQQLGDKMGLNKPTAELSLEQLEAFKETIEKLISHREALEVLGDDEYC
ncbi:hypothetical protein ACNQKP_10870 [Bdellovibrio bacteriovorus]|uniref:hypothetical protein n=1 Tax=Bdellovibrio bacteriovorus TaxID=959 RepID=UPI003AA7D9CB